MTTDRVRSVILEAVDCLRQRKCRPDRESIAVFVMRKLGCSMSEIYSEIEHVVDQGELIKVVYKGSISYRSPKNFDVKNSPLLTKHSKILNSSKTTGYINSGINELLSAFPNFLQDGVPYEELKKKLAGFDPERFAESGIKVIFEREESTGNILVAQSDDPVYPLRIFPKDIKVPKGMTLTSFVEEPSESAERKRRRRPKRDDLEEWNKNNEHYDAESLSERKNDKPKVIHTLAERELELQDPTPGALEAIIKTKTRQIGSIGLKVISEKGKGSRKRLVDNEEAKEESNQEKSPIKTNDGIGKEKAPESNGKVKKVGPLPTSSTQVENLSAKSASKSKKRKAVSSKKPPKLESPVQSDNESTDSQLFINLSPLRFTYAAKRRTSYDSYSESFKRKIPKKPEVEPEVQNSVSVVVLTANGCLEKCTHCQKEIKHVNNSDIVSCATCNSKTHLRCLNCSEERTKRFKLSSFSNEPQLEWECTSCQRCRVCQNVLMSSDVEVDKSTEKIEQKYLLCDKCDKGYHFKCVEEVPKKNHAIWHCKDCNNTKKKADAPVVAKSAEPPVNSGNKTKKRPQSVLKENDVESCNEDPKVTVASENPTEISPPTCPETSTPTVCDTDIGKDDEDIPDISSWTPSQVQIYFSGKGLHDAAASLREQEIDGMSLLLLRRADIIFGLNLRLGPALKIYRLVCQLQQHSSVLKSKTDGGGTSVSQNKEVASSNS